jgi:hypothetical protein
MANFTTIQIRRDISANWSIKNPTLASGEFGYETDTVRLKIGDGSTSWNYLPYFTSGGGGGGGGGGSGTVSSVGMTSSDLDISGAPISTSGTINLTLRNTGVNQGTYGSTASIPIITVDSKGRITNVTVSNLSSIFLSRVTHDDSLFGDGTVSNPIGIDKNIDGGSAVADWGADSDLSGIYEGFPEYLDAGGP